MGQARLVGTEMASLKADLSLARGYGMGFKPQKDMTWDLDLGLSKNRPNRQAGPLTALPFLVRQTLVHPNHGIIRTLDA